MAEEKKSTLSWKDKGGRLSVTRIGHNLRKSRDTRDLSRLWRAHEEILMHVHGRPKDRRKLAAAVEKDDLLWLYMAARGWLPEGPTGPFQRGVRS